MAALYQLLYSDTSSKKSLYGAEIFKELLILMPTTILNCIYVRMSNKNSSVYLEKSFGV